MHYLMLLLIKSRGPLPSDAASYGRAIARRVLDPKDIVLRKEVIQPQVPLRLPCYDLVPLTSLTFGRSIGAGLRVLPAWVT